MSATSAIPWLPTTGMQAAEDPSLAEQVAMMLHAERQVMILITGSDSGRLSGFLADLTHAASHADTVLRIKAAIDVEALFVLLAGQMNLPTQSLTTMQLATQVGERLPPFVEIAIWTEQFLPQNVVEYHGYDSDVTGEVTGGNRKSPAPGR